MTSWNLFHGNVRKTCWLHHLPAIQKTRLKMAMYPVWNRAMNNRLEKCDNHWGYKFILAFAWMFIYTKYNIPSKRLKTWQQSIRMYSMTSFWKSIYNWLKHIYFKITELQKILVCWTCSILVQLWYVSWVNHAPSQGCKRGAGLPWYNLIFIRLETDCARI